MRVTDRAVQLKIQSGALRAIPISGPGGNKGVSYQIPVSALPIEAQALYGEFGRGVDADVTSYKEKYGEEGLARLIKRRDACRACIALENSISRGQYAQKVKLSEELGISVSMLYKLKAAYKAEGMKGLMETTMRRDKGTFRSMCAMAQDYCYACYMNSGQPNLRKVYANVTALDQALRESGQSACDHCPHNPFSQVRYELIRNNSPLIGEYPACDRANGEGMIAPNTRHTVGRFFQQISPEEKGLARRGLEYWKKEFMVKIRRDKPAQINQIWFGDHHVFDLFVLYEGKALRPWLTAWTDAKSGAFVGWILSFAPNSQTIMESFIRGVGATAGSPFEGAPMWIIIDNGKDYLSRRFKGDDPHEPLIMDRARGLNVDANGENSLLRLLDVQVHRAIPYYPWVKNIERIFETIEDRWIRELPGYCSNKAETRPETLERDIREKRLWTFEQFAAYWVNVILPEYHGLKSEETGLSPMEIYEAGEKARPDRIDWKTLSIARKERKECKVQTTGITLNKTRYEAPELRHLAGQWVTVLHGGKGSLSVTVLKEGQVVCVAGQASRFAMTGEDPERVAAHMADQKRQRKEAAAAIRLPWERVQLFNGMIGELPDYHQPPTLSSFAHGRIYQQEAEARKVHEKRQEARNGKKRSEEFRAMEAKRTEEGLAFMRQNGAI